MGLFPVFLFSSPCSASAFKQTNLKLRNLAFSFLLSKWYCLLEKILKIWKGLKEKQITLSGRLGCLNASLLASVFRGKSPLEKDGNVFYIYDFYFFYFKGNSLKLSLYCLN